MSMNISSYGAFDDSSDTEQCPAVEEFYTEIYVLAPNGRNDVANSTVQLLTLYGLFNEFGNGTVYSMTH